MKLFYKILILLLLPVAAFAQEKVETKRLFAVQTNLFDWADLGTINADFTASVSQHFSLQAGVKYNPWKFNSKTSAIKPIYNNQISGSLGVRYWPWYVFSGWWICFKAQYCDYSETGVWRPALDQGKALGAGLSAGYTLMLNKHMNIEFGAGFWGGRLLEHNLYCCPECMEIRESGPKNFIALNDLNVSLQFLF